MKSVDASKIPSSVNYPSQETLATRYNLAPVPIMFNPKNGNFQVTIKRTVGTKGELQLCSPSLKGLRYLIAEDAKKPIRANPPSLYGKTFGRPGTVGGKRRTRRHRRSTRRH